MNFKNFLLAGVIAAGFTAAAARADTIVVTYGAAGVQTASSVVVSNANVLGVETFNTLSLGNSGFSTSYGTGGVITGTYSPGADIVSADQYGGAGGNTRYVDAINGTSGYTISLATNGVPGVNYFGYWLSALDAGNQLQFLRGGVVVGTYTPSDLLAALGACNGANAYCGNPNPAFHGQNAGQPYAFVNFVDTSGYFDQIKLFETPSVGNYESDNHTVAYCSNAAACITGHTVTTDEPTALPLIAVGLLGLGIAVRRRRA